MLRGRKNGDVAEESFQTAGETRGGSIGLEFSCSREGNSPTANIHHATAPEIRFTFMSMMAGIPLEVYGSTIIHISSNPSYDR